MNAAARSCSTRVVDRKEKENVDRSSLEKTY